MVQEAFIDLGWLVLQGRSLADGAPDPRFILLHQNVGVVLLDAAPGRVPDAVERLRRRLHVARFGQQFPGHLPVIYCSLTEQDLWRLSVTLDTAFGADQPMGLRDQEWIPALEALLPSSAPAMPRSRAEQPSPRPAASMPRPKAAPAAAPRPAAAAPLPWAQDDIAEADFPALLPPSPPPRAFSFSGAGSAALVLLAMAASGAVVLEHIAPQQTGPAWRHLAGLLGHDGAAVPEAAPRQVLTTATAEAAPALPVPRPVALTPPPPSSSRQEEGGRISTPIEPTRAAAQQSRPQPAEATQRALPPLPATATRSLSGETPPVPLVSAEAPPFPFLSTPSAEAARLVATTAERPPVIHAAAPLLLAAAEPAPLAAAADP
ncbi:hypothetical protein IBL25_09940, partial [Roseomonas ludipueritiae]|nr:hypothetical protein [Pseudoroseomonas ludipueritiae]